MTPRRDRSRHRFQRAPALGVLALMVGGCGGGGSVPAPSALTYASPQTWFVGTPITAISPSVNGTVTQYSVMPGLPAGLLLNATTGQISGTPTTPTAAATYVVTAGNASGSTSFSLMVTVLVPPTPAPTETVLHSFGATSSDGWGPVAGMVQGTDGSFYGITPYGGTNTCLGVANNCGTVFKITPEGVESVVYSFGATQSDGYYPADLMLGPDGNFYGTTTSGGANTCFGIDNNCGTVFKLTPAGIETVLYSFGASSTDGNGPEAGLTLGPDGRFYGTTAYGGSNLCTFYDLGVVGCGTVFTITAAGVETLLYSFGATDVDGATPFSKLTLGTDGNFYGTTHSGGGNSCSGTANSCGTAFAITREGVETVLHSFGATSTDGEYPFGLILGMDGNFYATTPSGGTNFTGTVVKITPEGVETVLYSFGTYDADGANPAATLTLGTDGNLYGTTEVGGDHACSGRSNNCGTAFKITPAGVETVLYSFGASSTDGANPQGTLALGADGKLYGTTSTGGTNLCPHVDSGCGTAFAITP